MLNSNGKNGHPCLVPDFRGNAFNFFHWGLVFSFFFHLLWVCCIWLLLCWGIFLVCLLSEEFLFCFVLFCFISNECWILSKDFSVSIEIIIWFLPFNLLIWCIIWIDLQILKNPCILGIKPTWLLSMLFLIYYWILIARILLRILASMFISDIGL